MINKDVCIYLKTKLNKEYFADEITKLGYGQNSGGYMEGKKNREEIRQINHFINHYGSKENINKLPTYNYLLCPELIIFISEVAGISKESLKRAFVILKEYEDTAKLKTKKGTYLKGTDILLKIKKEVHINEVTKIIKNSKNWKEVLDSTKNIDHFL